MIDKLGIIIIAIVACLGTICSAISDPNIALLQKAGFSFIYIILISGAVYRLFN